MRLGTGPSGTTLEPAYCETGRPGLRRTSGLVPTITEARVMIRRRDEDHSRCDERRVDGRGTAGSGGVGWFPKSRGSDARSSADRAVDERRHGISRDRLGGRMHAGYDFEMAGPLCQRTKGGSEARPAIATTTPSMALTTGSASWHCWISHHRLGIPIERRRCWRGNWWIATSSMAVLARSEDRPVGSQILVLKARTLISCPRRYGIHTFHL
jgi:hypothetical protein